MTVVQNQRKYIQTLSDLMDGKGGKNWSQRSKALQHFQRTVGMDSGAGVHVSVNQQTAVLQTDQPRSFEEALDVVRRRHAEANQEPNAITDSSDSASGQGDHF